MSGNAARLLAWRNFSLSPHMDDRQGFPKTCMRGFPFSPPHLGNSSRDERMEQNSMGSALCFYYGRSLMRVLNHRITEDAIFPATNQETREKNGGEEYLSYGSRLESSLEFRGREGVGRESSLRKRREGREPLN